MAAGRWNKPGGMEGVLGSRDWHLQGSACEAEAAWQCAAGSAC